MSWNFGAVKLKFNWSMVNAREALQLLCCRLLQLSKLSFNFFMQVWQARPRKDIWQLWRKIVLNCFCISQGMIFTVDPENLGVNFVALNYILFIMISKAMARSTIHCAAMICANYSAIDLILAVTPSMIDPLAVAASRWICRYLHWYCGFLLTIRAWILKILSLSTWTK